MGIALAGLIPTGFRSLQGEIGSLRSEIAGISAEVAPDPRGRMARLEGLRDAISGRVGAGS